MRRIYLLLSFALLASTAMAQIDVTFAVDMNGETVSADGVHVTGDWQEAAGGANWTPGSHEMTDAGGGIYTLTVNIPAGGYEYKYLNGNAWGTDETVPEVSQVGYNGNSNRYFQVTDFGSILFPVPFAGSAMDGMSAVKIQVDMRDVTVSENGAHAAGSMFDPEWIPSATPLYKAWDENEIWEAVIQVADGDYSYKFLTDSVWGADESVSGDCADGGNRLITVAGDVITDAACFGSCDPCIPIADPTDVTFRVDMNLFEGDLSSGVNVAGTFNGWSLDDLMEDGDGDLVYEVTIGLQPGNHAYKFRVVDVWEGLGDRPLTVVEGEAQILDIVCFNWPVGCPDEIYNPADVTFNCDVNDSTLAGNEFVWLMGDFTEWQGGAIKLTDDDADGIWTTTIANFEPQIGFYKFVIGTDPPAGDVWKEENADFSSIGGCGMDNGSFSDNRFMQRTSNDPMIICFAFNTCDQCLVGIEELESLNRVEVYPNPVVGDINIVFENSGQYSIRLLDVTGKVILSTEVNAAQTSISSENLLSGMYFIQITDNDNNTVTRKIVK